MEFKYGGDAQAKASNDRYIAAAGHFKNASGWAKTAGFNYISVSTSEDFDDNVEI
jgi:2-succinyl-5-enolpyruvyl-6-hydroxy-3-cyclohexene-1-carboxylate synthase